MASVACLVLLALALAVSGAAQETRWKELSAQVLQFYQQGKFAEALPLAQEAMRVAEATFGPGDPNVATSLNNLAALYKAQGRYAEAEPLYTRALAIREQALGPDHPTVAASLSNLALLYSAQGRYAEAEPRYVRALAIREKALGPEHPDVADSLNDLALLDDKQGRSAEAEPRYTRALAIWEKALGPDHPYVAASLSNLASLYADQGRYAEAEPLGKRALAIYEKALGPEHPDVAASLNNLAALYTEQGRSAAAEPLYTRALAIDEKALGPEHPYVATDLNNLAALYEAQGRYAEAEPRYARALAIREKALGPEHPDVATSLNNLAGLYKTQGRYAEAELLLKRALAIDEKALGPDHPDVAAALDNLAVLSYDSAQPAQAAPFFDRALAALARRFQYAFTYMSESERLAYLATVRYRFPVYFSFCLTYRQQVPGLAARMYDTVLWEKGFIAQSVAALRAKIRASGDAEALRLLDELTAKKTELATLATAPPEGEAPKQTARRTRLEQLAQEANALEQALVHRSRALAEEKRLAQVTWQQVRDALKPDEAAVELVRFEFYDGQKWTGASDYVALIVRPDSREPEVVLLGDAQTLEADPLRDYRLRAGLSESGVVRGVRAKEETHAAAPTTSFYQAFWKPLEPALGRARRVYVSTDGVVNQVALGVVPDAAGHLLMETYDLRLVSSTKDVLREKKLLTGHTAVVLGNPWFDMDEARQRVAVQAWRQTAPGGQTAPARPATPGVPVLRAPQPAGLRSRDLRGGTLKPLPGTQTEAETVSRLLEAQNWDVGLSTREQALEERVKGVQSPRVLHLATHGYFEPDQEHTPQDLARVGGAGRTSGLEDPMLRSGLYLTGATRTLQGRTPAADLDDGVLTAYEATQLDLHGTELVVLSACETGLGESQNGEGVFGLRRALQEAGAQTVLMSMWAVPDRETQELMTRFYQEWLGGKDVHDALRDAQHELRATVKARYGRDVPAYWGAFVLVGR